MPLDCMLYCSQVQIITCSAPTLRLTYLCVHSVPGILVLKVKGLGTELTINFHVLRFKVSSTVLQLVPVLSWPGAYLGNLYLVLHGQLFGVLCLSFFIYYRAVGLADFLCNGVRWPSYHRHHYLKGSLPPICTSQ